MAKFKVGEKARYVGSTFTAIRSMIGQECVVIDPLAAREDYRYMRDPEMPRYGVKFGDGREAWVKETSLEKLLPKHQDSDLKAAEPQFIHGQLQRWLNPEKEKTFEKSN
jgi:hypothetical protein